MTAEAILAWMLALQPAGQSPYSAVAVAEDVTCDTEWTEGCRRETEAEGTERYWTIARAVARSSPSDDLRRAVLTVLYHESGFRRDVHSGQGRYARGDQGRSWCLGQMLIGRPTPRALRLVGVDRAATDRCVGAVARHLGAIEHEQPYTQFARYGGVWTEGNRRILARVSTYRRLAAAPPPLATSVRRALGLPEDGS